MLEGTGQPEADRLRADRQRDLCRLAGADAAGRAVLPDEEGDERSGRAGGVTVEEVQLLGILETGGALDDTQAEEAGIEIDIGLHLAGDGRDVVDAACH